MNTAWVRTSTDLPDLSERLARPAFLDGRVLSIVFETDPELIAAVLPPPLEHDGSGIASVFVGAWAASNCVGPFAGGALNLRARYGGLTGNYCLTMPMSTDTAVIFGRELYGEPKKLARVSLSEQDGHAAGRIERHGVTFMTLEADLNEEIAAPPEASGITFHIKALPRLDGKGFVTPPQLIAVRSRSLTRRLRRGAGRLRFDASRFDPLAEFPVRRVIGAAFSEGDTFTVAEVVATLAEADYLPRYLGKIDPLDAWQRQPAAV